MLSLLLRRTPYPSSENLQHRLWLAGIQLHTGVCKINGVVIVVSCCYSIGFSTTNNHKNTVYFANTGICGAVSVLFLATVLLSLVYSMVVLNDWED